MPALPDRTTGVARSRAASDDADDTSGFEPAVVRGLTRARPVLLALLVLLTAGPVGWWSVAGDQAASAGDADVEPRAPEVEVTDGVMLIRSAACGAHTRCGTAFAVEIDGEVVLLTNRHVVEDACSTTAEPWPGGAGHRVREVRLATDADVAVLILADREAAAVTLPVARDGALLLGQSIQVVGFPGARPAILDGHVQRLEPERMSLAIDVGQGASGSPVMDADGAVVGQLYARSSDECCLATPIARVLTAARDAVLATVCP